MHEIVTIQLGSQANYVGTHFWNAQEAYFTYDAQEESPVDHAIHFREGRGADGVDTFTPRTIIYDFKNDFGSLRRINELYEQLDARSGSETRLWDGSVVTQSQQQVNANSYQRALNEGSEQPALTKADVRFWSDFNRVYYHPRSIVQIYETELNPGQRAFEEWSTGEELFASLDREESLNDRDLRPFVEECDQMQGFQLFVEMDSAWAGFSAKYLESLRDEFGKLPMWVNCVGKPEESGIRRALKDVNRARGLCAFSDQATMYVPVVGAPLQLPRYLTLDRTHSWHTSALQAAALESILLPSRLKPSDRGASAALDHLAVALAGEDDHRIAQLSFEVGDYTTATSYTNGSQHETHAARNTSSEDAQCDLFAGQDANVGTGIDSHIYGIMSTERGDWPDISNEEEETSRHRDIRYESDLLMPLPSSFPLIFSTLNPGQTSTRAKAQLGISSSIGTWAKSLEQSTRVRINIEEREELSNQLRAISDTYTWGMGSDDDDYDSDEF